MTKRILQCVCFLVILAMPTIASHSVYAQTPITAELIKTGLTRPLFAVSPPGDFHRLFIVEQRGSGGVTTRADVRIMDIETHAMYSIPFLSIEPVGTSSEEGLLGLAFHPNYANNRTFYTYHTNAAGNNVVTKWLTSSSDSNRADQFSSSIVLTLNHPFEFNHNGGWIAFGPDGYLYIATGDGGGSGDEHENSQNLNSLLGKILRIDVDSGSPYAIPANNPFVGTSFKEEILYWGLRNPWRNCFDPLTGDFYIADVGAGNWEEINWRPAADSGNINFGWAMREGQHCYSPTNCDTAGISTDPIHEYPHSQGCSISGGYVYRGCAIPDLQGTYFFGDYCEGTVWSFVYNGVSKTDFQDRTIDLDLQGIGGLASFGEDNYGEIYVLYGGGQVYKIVRDQTITDCNANGIIDSCEIALGVASDANSDGVPDDCSPVEFVCGDADSDGIVNISDAVFLIGFIFAGGPAPNPMALGDADCNANVNISDAVVLINYIFSGGPAPCSSCP